AKRPSSSSAYWIRLREMFPDVSVQVLARDEEQEPSLIGTPRQLLTSLLRWARGGGETNTNQPWAALYQWLSNYPPSDDAIDSILQELVSEMLRKKLDWSKLSGDEGQRMVEGYAAKISQTLAGEMMLSNARNRYLLKRMERTLEQIIAQQREISNRSGLTTL